MAYAPQKKPEITNHEVKKKYKKGCGYSMLSGSSKDIYAFHLVSTGIDFYVFVTVGTVARFYTSRSLSH